MTDLLYLADMSRLEADATVVSTDDHEDRVVVILDRTVFYPQGGGQPFDNGAIEGQSGRLVVEEVRWLDDEVTHIGPLDGELGAGEPVHLVVDADRRRLNTRLHSAGHVVDMAIDRLGLGWVPGKGYHFPQGPYVEYRGELHEDKETLIGKIEATAGAILSENHATETHLVEPRDLGRFCRFVPDYIPEGKPARVVTYGDFGVACGGTHVSHLEDIGGIGIRKLKAKGDTVRVSYTLH